MTPSRLEPPVALDLVPADQVRDIIGRTDVELTELERSAADARDAAERAEQSAGESGLDPESSAWTMVRLQRFLDGLREETRRDVDTMLELARQQARMRRSEASVGGNGTHAPRTAASPTASPTESRPVTTTTSTREPSPAPAPAVTSPRPRVPVVPVPTSPLAPAFTFTPESPVVAPDTERRVADEPTAHASEAGEAARPLMWAAPAAAASVAALQPVPDAEPWAERAPETPEPTPRLTIVAAPAANGASAAAPAPAASPVVTAPAPAPVAPAPVAPVVPAAAAPSAATPADAPTPHRSWLRRLPISAVLEVVAVLLILIFILLRLS